MSVSMEFTFYKGTKRIEDENGVDKGETNSDWDSGVWKGQNERQGGVGIC